MDKQKVVILASDGMTTNLLYTVLNKHFAVEKVFIENRMSKKIVFKRRIGKVGFWAVFGQVLFLMTLVPFLKINAKKRIGAILQSFGLKNENIPHEKIYAVNSVNDNDLVEKVLELNPTIIFINGTRIISHKTIQSFSQKLINIHVGITPKYRGVHGGYWALYHNEPNLFGTTLHLVDAGVDTGNIIEQKIIRTSDQDNFITYPILQYCEGLKLIEKNAEVLKANSFKRVAPLTDESQLFYHPTLKQYIFKRMFKGVK